MSETPPKPSTPNILTGITAIVIAMAIVGGAYWYMSGSSPQKDAPKNMNDQDAMNAEMPPAVAGDVKIGTDPYTLTDMNGQVITEKSFPDKYKLVFFGFTHCADICPIALQTITRAMENMGADAQKIQPLFISVDPKRDTPAVMKDYLKSFSPAIVGATGTAAQVKTAEDSFKVYAGEAKAEEEEGTEDAHDETHHHMDMGGGDADVVNHSDNIYLLKPGNGFVNVFNGDIDTERLTMALKAAIETK